MIGETKLGNVFNSVLSSPLSSEHCSPERWKEHSLGEETEARPNTRITFLHPPYETQPNQRKSLPQHILVNTHAQN